MFLTYVLLTLTIVTLSIHGLKVEDIFPQELIAQANLNTHEDYGLNIYQFLDKYGYPFEDHAVTTEDGYILTMQRIPHGRKEAVAIGNKKPAVLLMHGLLCSSMEWVNKGPDSSLALNLADAGYDVWLGNNRGNTWSRRHVSLDPDTDKEFWDYSFDTCGYFDLPAKIDYILNITGHDKINYIGHSQGTTQFFAMATLRPQYNKKINLMTALAPVAYMKDLTQPLGKFAANYTTLLEMVTEQMGIYELLPHSKLLMNAMRIVCNDASPFQKICVEVLFFLGGANPKQFDPSFLEVIGSSAPAGISVKMLTHYLQEIKSGYFRRYDFGIRNFAVYKRFTPPVYNISSITAPVALYYARNDPLSAVSDVEYLASQLPNLVKKRLMEDSLFSHLDFIWAIEVKTMLNDDVIAYLDAYNSAI